MQDSILILGGPIVLAILLAVIKTYFFYQATRRRTFRRWVYFNRFHLMDAATGEIRRLRQWQNALSVLLFICLIATLVIAWLFAKGTL